MTQFSIGEFFVREASWSDLDHLVEYNAAMAWETEKRRLDIDRLRAGTKAVLESPTRGFYVVGATTKAGLKEVVVSQLLVTYEWSDWRNASFWWIQSVYVHHDWRNRGVFRRMYHFVENRARSHQDVCGIRLYVEQENAGAIRVYDKLGLSPTPYQIYETDFILSGLDPAP